MASSKQVIPIIGLHITVYGLDEYNQLPKGTPVSIMFALHGRLQNQSKMEPIAQAICQLNEKRKQGDSHILVITFDSANHGSRLVHKLANFGWVEGKHKNPNHAVDMWSMVNSTARTVTELIDVVEHYIFGPLPHSLVRTWGCIGFSMGGHATFMASANDPRITVAIPIVGMADFLGLMESRLKESNMSSETYLPKHFCDNVLKATKNMDQQLKSKHILIINGENDTLVKAQYNRPLIESLRHIHTGKEGQDWKYYLVPGVGHEWCPEMFESSVQWCQQWMTFNKEKMTADIFSLKKQLVVYGSHHNNKVNVAIHMVFVPTIFWTALVFASNTGPLVTVDGTALAFLKPFGPNLAFFTVVFYLTYYAILDPIAASIASPILVAMSYTATKFLETNPKANKIALAIHIISWIFQFLGHGLAEKRSPKLLDNLVQALVSAPYFVFFEVLFFLGYRPKLYKEVMTEINKDVAEFKASKFVY
ncbi:hypothetical protein [Parasitella parasitica]|uniref:Peptidase S9 prolyl oligopeptidase catalytic domain-containing protein n=1 Tax=Parasitella parasitica TaxID=35722 RepID=A0A0B7NTX5_9FUNG|nr:hypothetical protein [Parasitella parasitica]